MNFRKEPCLPPLDELFIKEEYWALHEATFQIIKAGWPKYDMGTATVSPPLPYRSFIYLPESIKVDPTKYGEEYNEVYNDLKEAIEKGDLPFKTQQIDGIVFFVRPRDVIIWALIKGYILRDKLQAAIGIRQDISVLQLHPKTYGALPMKVKEKIVAQLLMAKNPYQSRTDLCKNVLDYLNPFASKNKKWDLTAIRRNLNELYDSPGKRGSKQNLEKDNGSYSLKSIQEVLKKDPEGNVCYNFFLFTVAMLEAANFKIGSIEKSKMIEMNKKSFLKEFIDDEVVSLYLHKSEYALRIMMKCVEKVWSDFVFSMSLSHFANKFSTDRILKLNDGKSITHTDTKK